MSGASVGAVTGSKTAYVIHNHTANQENHDHRRVSNGGTRQASTGNPRTPLSNPSAGRADLNEHGQAPQQRQSTRSEDMVSQRAKFKTGLEVESQQHLYARNGSNGNLSNAESDDIPENMYRPEKEDLEGWIHREKLAKIENEELQAAGINLAKARTRSREALGERLRTASRDRLRSDFPTDDTQPREEKRRKVSSPVPASQHADEDVAEQSHWDLRTPEEIAADQANSQNYSTPVLRKSGSKIPVLSPSANATLVDREEDTPESRKRTLSGSLSNEDAPHSPKFRTSSSKWNDDAGGLNPVGSSKTSSPTKKRQKSISSTPGSISKSGVPRKISTSTRPETSSSSSVRPRTRGNDAERPRTAVNPPEGDPPWLADMYKPDPRLPPDQQIIPTIAKKQRQMQWEESGMVPKTYDRDFEAIAVHDKDQPLRPQPTEPMDMPQKTEEVESWPLKPLPSTSPTKPAVAKHNTTTPPATTGGYSTMPKVSSPPIGMTSPKIGTAASTNVGAPSPNIGASRQTSATQPPPQRVQQRPTLDADDEKVQKKGCCGCVMM